jgi:hypothetical protein
MTIPTQATPDQAQDGEFCPEVIEINCPCGFTAKGCPVETISDIYDAHKYKCPSAPAQVPTPPKPWYSYVFNLLSLVAVCLTVLVLAGVRLH